MRLLPILATCFLTLSAVAHELPDVVEMDVAAIQAGYERGDFTAREVTEAYLERIEAIDPALNAVRHVNDRALEEAERLDRERAEGRVRGPLHGIPVLLKDNIGTADMPTTAGSVWLEGSVPPDDAFIVERLREEGAIILGKTNLSEWANFHSSSSSSGWSRLGGQVNNPYDTTRNPCGSSAGSGVAAAASLAALTRRAVEAMKAAGAEIVEIETITEEHIGSAASEVLLSEFRNGMDDYLASLGEHAPFENYDALIEAIRNDPKGM